MRHGTMTRRAKTLAFDAIAPGGRTMDLRTEAARRGSRPALERSEKCARLGVSEEKGDIVNRHFGIPQERDGHALAYLFDFLVQ